MTSTTDPDLVAAMQSVHRLVMKDPRDWSADRHDAFLYGVFAGWDCALNHDHTDACTARADRVAERHQWDDAFVSRLRRLRAAVHRLQEASTSS
jgi:hypothetical protein